MRVLVLTGDGIGPEVMAQGLRVLQVASQYAGIAIEVVEAPIGKKPLFDEGTPFPSAAEAELDRADAILFGALGDPALDHLGPKRPDSAIGDLRRHLGLFASFREIRITDTQADLSPLRKERAEGTDIMIVREISGDVYAAQPKGQRMSPDGPFPGEPEGFDTMRYTESEVRRIARLGFRTAAERRGKLVSADKSNVLETSRLWRRVVEETAREFPNVELVHQLADNVAMQLVSEPRSFDTILTANLFGDILSDVASILTGSIGLPGSAMFNEAGKGLYEPGHGTALDIAGKDVANPISMIRCVALLLRYSGQRPDLADAIECAIEQCLREGLRTAEIHEPGTRLASTSEMGTAIAAKLDHILAQDSRSSTSN